jgi:type I restriction enzyme S subunit
MNSTTLGQAIATFGGSIQTGPFGTVLKASEYSRSGVPIVSVGEVGYGTLRIRPDTPRAPESVVERLPRYVLRHGDIVFGRKGGVDRSAWVRPAEDGWFLGSDGIRVRFSDRVDSRFISYQLGSEATRDWLVQHASGSTMPSLNEGILARIPLRLPPLSSQRDIAGVLGAFDDKIAANTRLESTLTEYLSTTFDRLTESASRLIPLRDLVKTTKGVSYRSVDLAPSGVALVTLKSFRRNGGYTSAGLKPFVGAFKATQQITRGELVVAQTDLTQAADVIGRAVRIPPSREYESLVASLDLIVVRPLPSVPTEYIFGVLLDRRFRQHCKARTSGTTVLHLATDAIASYEAPDVPIEAQLTYASMVRPTLDLRDSLGEESRQLAVTRDALLPALMSGRLRVEDAGTLAGEVL